MMTPDQSAPPRRRPSPAFAIKTQPEGRRRVLCVRRGMARRMTGERVLMNAINIRFYARCARLGAAAAGGLS